MIFLIFLCKFLLSHQESSPVKQFNLTDGATGRIGSLTIDDQIVAMRPPFYIVPIEPDNADQFTKKVKIDLDNGDIYVNEPLEEPVKFSALSINQGSAMTIILNPVLKEPVECFNLIDGNKSDIKALKDSDKCLEIDSRIFSNNSCDSKIGVQCLDEPVLRLNQDSTTQRQDIILLNIGDYMLKVSCLSTDWFINLKLKQINVSLVEEQGNLVFNSNECEKKIEKNSTITNLIRINKFSLNLKLYLIMLVSVVSFLIGFLLFLVNLAVKRINQCEKTKYPLKNSILSVNTIDTRTSVLIDYLDQSLNNGQLDTNKLILDEKNLNSKLQYSTGYLSQMGINVSDDLRDLKEKKLLANINTDGVKLPASEIDELTVKRWCELLEWNVDFASFSNVIDDMASLKK